MYLKAAVWGSTTLNITTFSRMALSKTVSIRITPNRKLTQHQSDNVVLVNAVLAPLNDFLSGIV
jgi:hypothetical protein